MLENTPTPGIETRILHIRGHKVLLDRDLAELYGVTTSLLNQAVKRNFSRFPADFMFQLTSEESQNMRSQFVTSSFDTPDGSERLRSQIVISKKGAGRPTLPALCLYRTWHCHVVVRSQPFLSILKMKKSFHRRSIRLPGYNYANPGAYFITLCTRYRSPLFGDIVGEEMR